jgi:uncharacterized membrane protein YvbJ
MKYCSNCGHELSSTESFCSNCGTNLKSVTNHINHNIDKPSAVLEFLSFFFPLIGLIVYAILLQQSPLKAKSALVGAIWGVITYFGFILFLIFLFSLAY